MSDVSKLRQSRKYKTWAAAQRRRLGDRCAICGHPGAGDLDHIVPVVVDPSRVMDPTNVQMAHGIEGCPYCPPIITKNGSRRPACNQVKGAGAAVGALGAAVRSPNARGCPECLGERCNNGVRDARGMVTRCW